MGGKLAVKTLASFLNAAHVSTENISFFLKGVPMSTVDLNFFSKGVGGKSALKTSVSF